MREFKFKAYNKSTGKMHNVDAIDFSGGTIRKGEPCFIEDAQNGGCFLLSNSILVQFTGLYDKNGKAIFEGDVLNSKNDGSDGCDVWDYSDHHDIIVKWDDESCGFNLWELFEETSVHSIKYIEVIGNIYEDKELL